MRRLPWLLLALAGCAGGSETGNPFITQTLSLGAYSTDPQAVAVVSDIEGTVIDEAWVSFGELQFLEGDCAAQVDSFDEPVPTRLVADLAEPVELSERLPDDAYCGIVVPLQMTTDAAELPGGAPPELIDHSVVLKGRRADGVPFELMHPERDELELLSLDGDLPTGEQQTLLMFFDVAFWMSDVDLDGAVVDADGVIRIDDATNVDQWHQFEDFNLECSMQMFVDHDDDGAIGADDELVGTCPPD